ncbi:DUF11 domain-containing protein [Patescibacteria group bacterium]|nr:DUF11 domain-containing protein [Patescibacteria group bacterium]MBU4458772.1 DUF11 domain-containing protein [Patescibacteria group bacterium]MCG2696073.1 hypothetical protein [Candidatus Portnoybacteria bacterium]
MKNLNKNLIISISGTLITVAVIFGIGLTISGSIINTASATGNFEVSVVETGGRRACKDMPPFSNTGSRYFTYTISVENNSDKVYRINKAAFLCKTARCGFCGDGPAGTAAWQVISGEQTYAPGQKGTLVLQYDVNRHDCGSVQYDAGYYAKDGTGGTTVFIGDVINYGVDCSSPPPPTLSCSLSTNPSSGTSPLNDVDLTANVSGTATGNITYSFDCTNNGTWEHVSAATTINPYTIANLCDYASAGTYTVKAKATRQGVSATCTNIITVTPNPAPTCLIAANPTTISAGQYSTLNWTSRNATSCTASNAWSGSKSFSGTQSVSPTSYSTYTLNCSGPGGTVTCSASVTVNPAPTLSCSLSANPSSGTAPLNGVDLKAIISGTATGTINYTFYCNRNDSGTNITYPYNHKKDGTNQNPYTAVDICDYSLSGIYTGKLIVEREGLATECRTSVNITSNPAPTCSIAANPTTISEDEYSTLNWTSRNATSCTASNAWSGSKSLSGTQSVSPTYDSTYTLNCSGPGGTATCSASVAVTPNPAPTCSIAANPTTISEDEYSTLNWTSQNATSCTASNAWSGSKSLSGTQSVSPDDDSIYALTCHNSSVSVSCSTYILVREEDNAELEINKLVRNISDGNWFSNSVHADYNDELEFSLEVHSNGNGTAENVRVWDNLPSYLTYISGSTTLDGSYRGDGITTGGIYIGDLHSGQTKTIKFKVRVSSQNYNNEITLTNYGYASADNANYVYNTALVILEGGEYGTANIRINKLVRNITNGTGFYDSVNAKPGDEVEFSIDLSSIGNKEANNVKVWDTLPFGLTYISGSTTINGSYFGDGIVSNGIYIGTIVAGANKEVRFRTKVGSISGTSEIITVDVGNQNVQISGNISVSKMGRNVTQNQTVWSYTVPAYYGDTLEISIQATNNSGSTVNNITVKEILPSSLSLISGSTTVDGGSWSGDIINGINLGTMTNGQIRTIKFRVTVVGGTYNVASGVLNNIAYANADNISQIYDQASVVISGQSGEVLGASVVTGMGLTPFLFVPMTMSLIIAFFIYCRLREEKILDYLNKEKGNKFMKFLIRLYFKIKLRFKLANVRFRQVYL